MGAVPKAVKPSVAPSTGNSLTVLNKAQLGPYQAATGSSYVPYVPGNEEKDIEQAHQPAYGTRSSTGHNRESGSAGAPSVPGMGGALFKQGPADPHYLVEDQGGKSPYHKVNNPKTRGMFTWVQAYANHIFNGKQNVNSAGWQQSSPQQRTSWMRITTPPHGDGYAPESYVPRQLPQQSRTQKFLPTTGHGDPGTLNSSTYGAGQTAGGIGGSQ